MNILVNQNSTFQELYKKYGSDWDKNVNPEQYYEVLFNSSGFNGKSFYWLESFRPIKDDKKKVWGNLFPSRSGGNTIHIEAWIVHHDDTTKNVSKKIGDKGFWDEYYQDYGKIIMKMIEDKYGVRIDSIAPADDPPGPEFIEVTPTFQEMNKKYGYDWGKDVTPQKYYEILFNSTGFDGSSFYWLEPFTSKGIEGKKTIWANYFNNSKELHTIIVHRDDMSGPMIKKSGEKGYWEEYSSKYGLILIKIIEDRFKIKIDRLVPTDHL